MNAVTKIEAAGTHIATVVEQTPVIVLTDHDQRDAFYAHIQREVDAFQPDVSTEKGRKEIKSFAYKITRTKTAIDDAGKKLNEEARARINAVDAERRVVKEKLDALAKEVRRPLTEWEEAEEKRIDECRAVIERIKASAVVTIEDTAATVRARGAEVWNTAIDADRFGDMLAEATATKEMAVSSLKSAMARLAQEEADKAELERLRAEAAEREERDRIEREAREAEEHKRKYAADVIEHIRQCTLGMIGGKVYPYIILLRELEEKIVVSEADFGDMAGEVESARVAGLELLRKAQAEQAERKQREIADQARQEAAEAAERAAREEQAKRDREHAEQLAAERRRAEDAERAAQAERDRIAAEEAKREAEAKRLADEQAAREADQAHRSAVMKAAKEAIMTCGVDEDTAKKIVLLIRSGEVPNVSLRF